MAQICKVNSGILVFNFQPVFRDSTAEMTPVKSKDNQPTNCQLYKIFSFQEVLEDLLLLIAHHIAPHISQESLDECLDSGLNVVSVLEDITAVPSEDGLGDAEGEI